MWRGIWGNKESIEVLKKGRKQGHGVEINTKKSSSISTYINQRTEKKNSIKRKNICITVLSLFLTLIIIIITIIYLFIIIIIICFVFFSLRRTCDLRAMAAAVAAAAAEQVAAEAAEEEEMESRDQILSRHQ